MWNIYHRQATLFWRFYDSGAGHKTPDLLTYLLTFGIRSAETWNLCKYHGKTSLKTTAIEAWKKWTAQRAASHWKDYTGKVYW